MPPPDRIKLYHICHVDRLRSISQDGFLWSGAQVQARQSPGTTVGMSQIKQRRLNELALSSHPGLYVGQCVPFYFAPRSVMLFLLHRGNHPDLAYSGGQRPILHLQFDLQQAVAWARREGKRWAFTLSNAGSRYFEDYCDLTQLNQIDWEAVHTNDWKHCRERKQAEFMVEDCVPWPLVEGIGTFDEDVAADARRAISVAAHKPKVGTRRTWYY
jgi:hypothetical protein